jgi:hypothetical protein
MVERNQAARGVKFAGDPEVKETGTGQPVVNPLGSTVQPTQVEMLDKNGDEAPVREPVDFRKPAKGSREADVDEDDEDEEEDEVAGPQYSRERIGSRIGEAGPEAMAEIDLIERNLDTEDVVSCLFQKPVNLQDKGIMHHFGVGVQLVPVSLAGETKKDMHWYLKAHGVKRMQKAPSPNPNMAMADED